MCLRVTHHAVEIVHGSSRLSLLCRSVSKMYALEKLRSIDSQDEIFQKNLDHPACHLSHEGGWSQSKLPGYTKFSASLFRECKDDGKGFWKEYGITQNSKDKIYRHRQGVCRPSVIFFFKFVLGIKPRNCGLSLSPAHVLFLDRISLICFVSQTGLELVISLC